MKRSEKVQKLFIEETEDEETYFVLNDQLTLGYKNKQAGAQFLVEAIRCWHDKRRFFCHDNTDTWEGKGDERKRVDLPEDEWSFSYKTPSTCGGCVSGQKILGKIFGGCGAFNSLPCVIFHGDRSYSFDFELLKYYAENGHDAVVQMMDERKQEKARKEAEAEAEEQRKLREEQDAKLAKRLDKTMVSDELYRQIMKYADDDTLVVVNENIAVVQDSRSEWGSSGGIGYYDQVRVFCGSQSDMKEWQWRDRYEASRDRHDLRIDKIGKVHVSAKGGKVSVEIELVNSEYRNRSTTFTFDKPKTVKTVTLSIEEQAKFTAKVNEEMERIMAELERLWECKPEMVSRHIPTQSGYTQYRRPSFKQKEFHPEIGVVAFVTEEQIDARVSDPQMRYELYVLTAGGKKADCVAEDHGYEREGGAFLAILEVSSERVVYNTKSGKSTIQLKS